MNYISACISLFLKSPFWSIEPIYFGVDQNCFSYCDVIFIIHWGLFHSPLLRNLYAGQEATVRIGHGTTDWFKFGKGVSQGSIFSPCLFNLYAEYIMWNARLDDSQTGIKIARRNINNLRYADETTLMAESEDELKSFLMRVKEENEKAGLKLNIQKLRSWHLVPSLLGK